MAADEKDREVTYDIAEHLGVFGKDAKGWTKELNKVSWNGGPAKYDMRSWDEGHAKMSKGITLSQEELLAFRSLIEQLEL
jgi:hypothetical protein